MNIPKGDVVKINWQAMSVVLSFISILIIVIVAWIKVNVRIAEIETTIQLKFMQLEKDTEKCGEQYTVILDELNNIKVILVDKQDRPKM